MWKSKHIDDFVSSLFLLLFLFFIYFSLFRRRRRRFLFVYYSVKASENWSAYG